MPSSDKIVTAKAILQAQLELQRLGINKAMERLESTEPELAEVVIETTSTLYHQILRTGATSKQARRIHNLTLTLVLTSLGALRQAYAALWPDGNDDVESPHVPPLPPENPPQ